MGTEGRYLNPDRAEDLSFNREDIEKMIDFFSNKANVIRRQIGRLPQCQVCTEPGLERYSLPYEGFQYLKLFFKMGSDEFFQLHYYLGLDKYM